MARPTRRRPWPRAGEAVAARQRVGVRAAPRVVLRVDRAPARERLKLGNVRAPQGYDRTAPYGRWVGAGDRPRAVLGRLRQGSAAVPLRRDRGRERARPEGSARDHGDRGAERGQVAAPHPLHRMFRQGMPAYPGAVIAACSATASSTARPCPLLRRDLGNRDGGVGAPGSARSFLACS